MTLRQLLITDYINFYKLINEFRTTKFTQEQFIETLKSATLLSEIWVYEEDDRLIGTGTIIFEHKFIFNISMIAHIEDVCVASDFRRRGIGKIIVNKLIERAREKNCYKIILNCSDENVTFYESCNFHVRGNNLSQLL